MDHVHLRNGFSQGRLAVLAGLALLAAGAALGQPPAPPDPVDAFGGASLRTVQQRGISLSQAAEIAQRRFGGRVVRATTRVVNGRRVHEIRILVEGRVRTVLIDAQTGEFR
jgi:uncharacterized membrane protein YkoI